MARTKQFTVPALSVTQPIGTFYVTSIPWRALVSITFADVRRLETSTTEIEQYLGIQRKLEEGRLAELKQFLNTIDASFPTSIVIAVGDTRCVELSSDQRELSFFSVDTDGDDPAIDQGEIARIIDGQHRLAGLRAAELDEEFDIPVTVFTGLDIADQAYIFATVNLAQTKVNRSLILDLSAYSRSRNPEKTSHYVAVTLNAAEGSPLFRSIKRLGSATPGVRGETLTQELFVDGLLPYITKNRVQDRDDLRRGIIISKANATEFQSMPFRNLFLAERDDLIASTVWNYFDSVRLTWPAAWDSRERGAMLKRANGFRAFMKVLGRAYIVVGGNDGHQPTVEEFQDIWKHTALSDVDFTSDRFHTGTSGLRLLVRELESSINIYRTQRGQVVQI